MNNQFVVTLAWTVTRNNQPAPSAPLTSWARTVTGLGTQNGLETQSRTASEHRTSTTGTRSRASERRTASEHRTSTTGIGTAARRHIIQYHGDRNGGTSILGTQNGLGERPRNTEQVPRASRNGGTTAHNYSTTGIGTAARRHITTVPRASERRHSATACTCTDTDSPCYEIRTAEHTIKTTLAGHNKIISRAKREVSF